MGIPLFTPLGTEFSESILASTRLPLEHIWQMSQPVPPLGQLRPHVAVPVEVSYALRSARGADRDAEHIDGIFYRRWVCGVAV